MKINLFVANPAHLPDGLVCGPTFSRFYLTRKIHNFSESLLLDPLIIDVTQKENSLPYQRPAFLPNQSYSLETLR